MNYAQLHSLTNFSFLRSASHPHELVETACMLGYQSLAITDECSVAGMVKAWARARELKIHLIAGSEFYLQEGCHLTVLVPDLAGWKELCGLISLARRRSPKGQYQLYLDDLRFRLRRCLVIWMIDMRQVSENRDWAVSLKQAFGDRLWVGAGRYLAGGETDDLLLLQQFCQRQELRAVACPQVWMHVRECKPLLDVLTAIRLGRPVQQLGTRLAGNAERCLKSRSVLQKRYPSAWLEETRLIASRCHFRMEQLRYQYPAELVPEGLKPIDYLRDLTEAGARVRWPQGVPDRVREAIEYELKLVEEMQYEYYFLTVQDLVRFARSRGILCQGRGSAANSVVCYCLQVTEVSPDLINMLFERFISKERDEPPDIDIDFEHQRREEVIQYIYRKYGRERAALAATVITYRARSAVRDVGKALGLDPLMVDELAKSLAWWDRSGELQKRIEATGLSPGQKLMQRFYDLVHQILGFPRHLSQHVGGFIITRGQVSELVPLENAAMPERTVIQWDKEDIELMGLLKVDVLALGMLSAIRRALDMVSGYQPDIACLADIPKEDPATYEMLSRGDSVGVFQVESRAQMSMLPRLKPRTFYDLVIEIAIVRPGPIQGDMVHPYLRRRNGLEQPSYPSDEIREVLEPTLGVPIFQEQAIRLSMVAAGFTGGEADQLRRAMASWGKNGNLLKFEQKLIQGMLNRGYSREYADQVFSQVKGFGGYGFPEAHSASFALLCYFSSWLKRHHPAAFYCALLNSQPMGFYSPSQLVQDAQRHGIQFLPVDVQHSDWENGLVRDSDSVVPPRTVRLGLSRVKGLSEEAGRRIQLSRPPEGFISVESLARCAGLDRGELKCLASADALASLAGHRYQARWVAAGVERQRGDTLL